MSNPSFWKNRKVFVTGGTGLLGSEMVTTLLDFGANVVTLVRDRTCRSRFFLEDLDKKVDIVYGDITDFSLVERSIGEHDVNTIFHLAAQTIVGIANASPISTFKSNIEGTWNVLEAARQHSGHIRSVVVASSDKAYGPSDILPYDESTCLRGRHPYDVSKSCTDLIAQSYYHTYDLPVSITRCGNLFGPGDLNFNRLIPGTIKSILNGTAPILRSDGTFIRNFFYTKDAVDGYLTLSENLDKGRGEAFNFGTEERYSVLEATNIVLERMNSTLQPDIQDEVKNEIKDQYLGVSKAKNVLGWTPKYTMVQALDETIAWYKEYFGQE